MSKHLILLTIRQSRTQSHFELSVDKKILLGRIESWKILMIWLTMWNMTLSKVFHHLKSMISQKAKIKTFQLANLRENNLSKLLRLLKMELIFLNIRIKLITHLQECNANKEFRFKKIVILLRIKLVYAFINIKIQYKVRWNISIIII